LGLKKVIPIMAHPERNYDILSEPEQLLQWIHQGALLQMNAGSIIGQFGKKCQRFSERLLKAQAVHIVASDAHDSNNRNYAIFQRAFERVRNLYGSDYAYLLFEKNPRNILDGTEVSRLQIREEKIRNIFLQKIFGK
jgi:protein-tyrosine phosphatase